MDNDNKIELSIITAFYQKKGSEFHNSTVYATYKDAIADAIEIDTDNSIDYIIKTHQVLMPLLAEVLKAKYPNKLSKVEKLLLLC